MIHSFFTGVEPAMEKRKLQRLTRQELKTLVANKDNLDHDFPEHSKTIESTDFWEIAQKKTFEKLSLPLWAIEAASTAPGVSTSRQEAR